MLNPEAGHCPTREQNAQPKSRPPSNEGTEYSTQKLAIHQQGSRMFEPEAGHHTTQEDGAQLDSWPANAKNNPLIMLKHEL